MTQSREYEVKVVLSSCSELDLVRKALARLGARLESVVVEVDLYYQHPCRDFAKTDEALRIRTSGSRVELTYKGPKRVVGEGKERLELTVGIEDLEKARRILELLGFREVARVVKRREYYSLGRAVVTLDEVEELGCFVEIEARGTTHSELVELVKSLGLEGKPKTIKSYLEMILERRGALTSR